MGENLSILGGDAPLERLKQMDATPVGDHVTALHFAKRASPRVHLR